MLRSIKSLKDFQINATDGKMGSVKEFLFDDHTWEIKYLVAQTGNWLIGRKILIAPPSFGSPNWENQSFPVLLRKQEIENGPPISDDRPVSRQAQADLHQFYGWPGYIYDPFPTPLDQVPQQATSDSGDADPHLRSTSEVEGYRISATDGSIGKLDDFIVDDDKWVIRYVIVDTGSWLTGRKVMISPDWIDGIDWFSGKASVSIDTKTIEKSPEFDPSRMVNRQYETRLYDYYGRPKYWDR